MAEAEAPSAKRSRQFGDTTPQTLSDEFILDVASKIPYAKYNELGVKLGFTLVELNNIMHASHRITNMASTQVLMEWKTKHGGGQEQRETLTKILREVLDMGNRLETTLQQGSAMTEKDVNNLKQELKDSYRQMFSDIRTSPLYDDSNKRLQQIYVNIVLLKGKSRKEQDKEEQLDNEQLLEFLRTETEKGLPARVALWEKRVLARPRCSLKLHMTGQPANAFRKSTFSFLCLSERWKRRNTLATAY